MTSGYDALDELYERLRGTEDARRAGGITPETIRAARGGVVDVDGREYRETGENAADGDSAPLVDISRDSRERIEADAWEAARLDMSRTWEERRDAIVALLDRQAALTEREICKWWRDEEAKHDERIHRISELQGAVDELNAQNTRLNAKWAEANVQVERLRVELDELNDKLMTALNNQKILEDRLWEYDGTHMLLPVDADGVPIQIGDLLSSDEYNGRQFPCRGMSVDVQACGKWWTVCMDYDSYSGTSEWCAAKRCHHVNSRTVEDVLRDLVDGIGSVDFDALTAIDGAAAEIRELMEMGK